MINLLSRLFVRDYQDVNSPVVRRRYGTMVSLVGIFLNLLLSGFKLLVGILSGSIAIMADAMNNLSDAGSSVISLISFRISARPPDRDHPFGHARIEYVASMIVAFLILVIGVEFLQDSIKSIFAEVGAHFDLFALIVLGVSVLGKLWLMHLNRTIGKRVSSSVMRAAAADSLSDVLATGTVLICAIVSYFVPLSFNLDGYVGILVALFILVSGGRILNETKNSILGEAPSEETVERIRSVVFSFPEALGIHDMLVHSYGAGHMMASLHVEVDGGKDVFASHEAIDAMEQALFREAGVLATIHLDPIVVGDPVVDEMQKLVRDLVAAVYPKAGVHDFRMVKGEKQSNLIFDLEIPFEEKDSPEKVARKVKDLVQASRPGYVAVIHIDRI